MSDLIDRQAAIDALYKMLHDCFWADDEELDAVITTLNEMPSVESERKKGKWIMNDNSTYSCSVCHSWIPEEQHYYARYCLYCGAEMDGER